MILSQTVGNQQGAGDVASKVSHICMSELLKPAVHVAFAELGRAQCCSIAEEMSCVWLRHAANIDD